MTIGRNPRDDDAPDADGQGYTPNPPEADMVYDEEDPTWAVVLVQWRDAHDGGNGWTFTSDYEPEMCVPLTVGWVWPKCKPGYLTIASTVMNDADDPDVVSNITHIPWENVMNVYSLAVHMPVNWNSELRD